MSNQGGVARRPFSIEGEGEPMTPRFDKSRPYGQISPPFKGAMFEQDGCYFSGSYEYMFGGPEAPKAAPAVKEPRPAAKAKPAAPTPPGEPARSSEAARPVAKPSGVDLAAWAKGEANYPFFSIKKAVQAERPEIILTNTRTIVDGLVAAGVVKAGEVKR